MAFTCGFFNSQNGDRKYNAEQMASIFDGLIKDGVYDTVGDIFAVTPGTGMQVLVGSGRAWFDHTWNNNDAQYPLAIAAADVSLPRYDAVVLETNHSDTVRTNRLRVLTGTPASNPVKPTMTSTANVKQHPLAYIKVTAGATAIKQSMIQVVVGTSECPFVTGIIDTAQIDALFQQWNGEFNEWFDNLKAQLSDNVVANLQGQIDQKVAKADVATTADINAGTSTTKWVSPKGLKDSGIDGYKVGDILNTVRTDLGDKWALCNGESVSQSNISLAFSSIYPYNGYDPHVPSFPEKYGVPAYIIEHNNQCIVAAPGSNLAKADAAFAKGTFPYSNWVNEFMSAPSNFSRCMLSVLKNYQNHIVGAGYGILPVSSSETQAILYTSNSFDSTITETVISSINNRIPTDIAFGGSRFVISFRYRKADLYGNYTLGIGTVGNNTITIKTLDDRNIDRHLQNIVYGNGHWFALDIDSLYDRTPPYTSKIYKSNTDDPNGNYTLKWIYDIPALNLGSGENARTYVSGITFYNGIFVISYRKYTDSYRATIERRGIYTATDLFSTWTLNQNMTSDDGQLFNTNGMLFLVTSTSVYMTNTPAGNWIKLDVPAGPIDVLYKNGDYYLLYSDGKSYTTFYKVLPTITSDKSYNYIKVK